MHVLAGSLLYSNFEWTWTFAVPPKTPVEEGPTSSKTPRIMGFTRTCLEKPQVASMVNEVVLGGDSLSRISHYYRGEPPALPSPDGTLQNLSLAAVDNMDMPQGDRDLWRNALAQGTVDAWVALLLSQLPNLRRLSLDENFVRDSCFIGLLFRWALCGSKGKPRPLQNLAGVHFKLALDMRARKTSRNTADMLSLFYLPAAENISVSIDNPPSGFAWPAEHPPSPSNLRSLELTMLREGHLGQILSTTTGLTRLEWSWFYCAGIRDRFVTDVINLDNIAADLSRVRATLTDLAITAVASMSSGDIDYPPVTVQGSFEALAKFEALKRLEAPLPFLMASMSPDGARELGSFLPRNLEELTITDDLYLQENYGWGEDEFPAAIRAWMEDWKRFTPRIRKFHLLLRLMDYDDWGPEARQQLRDLGARVGVSVEITKLAGDM